MPYFDLRRTEDIPAAYRGHEQTYSNERWTRWYYNHSANGEVIPFAIKFPQNFNPSISYPLVIGSPGSYGLGFDCLGYTYVLGGRDIVSVETTINPEVVLSSDHDYSVGQFIRISVWAGSGGSLYAVGKILEVPEQNSFVLEADTTEWPTDWTNGRANRGSTYLFNSASPAHYFNGSFHQQNYDPYVSIVVQPSSNSPFASWMEALSFFVKSLRDTGTVLAYTKYGTSEDEEASFYQRTIPGGSVLGDPSSVFDPITINPNKIFYSGTSAGGVVSWQTLFDSPDIWAGIMPVDIWLSSNEFSQGDKDFIASVLTKYIGKTVDVIEPLSQYYKKDFGSGQSIFWSEENNDYYGDIPLSKYFGVRDLFGLILKEILKRVGHVPIITINGYRFPLGARNLRDVYNTFREELNLADFIFCNRSYNSDTDEYVLDPHAGNGQYQKAYGVPFDGNVYVFGDFALDDNMGLIPQSQAGVTGITPFEKLLSYDKATNPQQQEWQGYGEVEEFEIDSWSGPVFLEDGSLILAGHFWLSNVEGVININQDSAVLHSLSPTEEILFMQGRKEYFVRYAEESASGRASLVVELPKRYALLNYL